MSAHQQTQSNFFRPFNAYTATRPALLSLAKLLFVGVANLPFIRAAPTRWSPYTMLAEDEDSPMSPDKPTLWIYLAVAVGLVLLGGAFAGLTIALMGQDEIYLQVIRTSGEGSEKKHAAKVLRLLERGKHWVLVTLLLGNVITNETLPIVLDRSLGGGWPAVLGSTVLIVIFGEIVPQSICVRYGLPIGAIMSPFVLILMYILGPVAWPTAKLLDKLLGEDHGTTYKKAGLKTLVTLHKTLGSAGEQLNSDEVTIISAVLDLKEKPVGSIMTPMDDVYTMSADAVLDEALMDEILSAGYSRIPIYEPSNPQNFVGMLLVKILITYDPEDGKRVRDFALATLPETRPETSCLDIVNFFQEGKSHMVLVSEFPGDEKGAQGVVTLEDVIEELIGEEIIDESDVFIDVSKRLRRRTAAPRSRVPKGEIVNEPDIVRKCSAENLIDVGEEHKEDAKRNGDADTSKVSAAETETSPKPASFLRRASSTAGASERFSGQRRAPSTNIRDQLRSLGPSNVASRPRQTRYNTVKIKPGSVGLLKGSDASDASKSQPTSTAPHEGTELLIDAGKDASDGVLSLHAGYGSMDPKTPRSPGKLKKGVRVNGDNSSEPTLEPTSESGRQRSSSVQRPESGHGGRSRSNTIILDPSREGSKSPGPKMSIARSGSLSENIIDAGGIRKVVLETTSSSDDTEGRGQMNGEVDEQKENGKPVDESEDSKSGKKKRRRKRKKAGKSGDDATLLEEDEP